MVAKAEQSYPKWCRLLKRRELDRVFAEGSRKVLRSVIVYYRAGDGPSSRLGVVVGRKLRGSVVRNRLKRMIREAFRRVRSRFTRAVDIVVIPRTAQLTTSEVQRSLEQLFCARCKRCDAPPTTEARVKNYACLSPEQPATEAEPQAPQKHQSPNKEHLRK